MTHRKFGQPIDILLEQIETDAKYVRTSLEKGGDVGSFIWALHAACERLGEYLGICRVALSEDESTAEFKEKLRSLTLIPPRHAD